MKNMKPILKNFIYSAAVGLAITLPLASNACTRALFVGSDSVVITGRSMDWEEDMHSDLWVFPRGIERNGAAGSNSIAWTSKYGSLITSGYNVGTADGMNEKGLAANALYLAESEYGEPSGKKPLLSISLWAQYVLDNFATVSETVDALKEEPFIVLAPVLPNGAPAQLHLSISDPSGDSAIFEYVKGKLVIHHGKEYQVMTNSPIFEKQLALNAYWEEIGGLTFLPGTNRAADRFARASFLIGAIPKRAMPAFITAVPHGTAFIISSQDSAERGKTRSKQSGLNEKGMAGTMSDEEDRSGEAAAGRIPDEMMKVAHQRDFINQAVASVLGVIRSVSVPLGITTPGQPNIASTLWRTVSDQKNRIYFFDSATSPNTFWIPLSDLDFSKGAPVKKLATSGGKIYSGNAAPHFEVSKPFTFLPAKT